MIDIPKTNAFINALNLFACLFMKNETVIGIIGNTQGVSRPAKPAANDIRKKTKRDDPFLLSAGVCCWVSIF